MSWGSLSKPAEAFVEPRAFGGLWWPRSLFGRLFAAVLAGVLLAQGLSFVLVTRDRERITLEGSVREWSRRIVDVTAALQLLDRPARELARERLDHWPPNRPLRTERSGPSRGPPLEVRDFREALLRQLQFGLGPSYKVTVTPTSDLATHVITMTRAVPQAYELGGQLYDVNVGLPDGDSLVFRVAQNPRGAPPPRNLLLNLALLTVLMTIALYVVARSITRPLSELARAAEAVGRDVRQPPLKEQGTKELREAARAFNTMQDRMQRYLDSRTRVLAAMSHDLKTPLTRLRLRLEMLTDPEAQARFARDLDEMEGMVRGTLALLRGLNDDETRVPIDMNALVETLRTEFAELGAQVQVQGRATRPYTGKAQALKRCLTNLISNAVNFGTRATVTIEDGAALVVRVKDDGPGLPHEELERVFEPFYRVESSRNRDTGGTGLGLSIARDIAQAHGGSLILRNLPDHGLEAVLALPRVRPS